jgi:hypothetical protein
VDEDREDRPKEAQRLALDAYGRRLDFATKWVFFDVVEEVRRKKNLPCLDRARLESFDEGYCVQIIHVGSYSPEADSIAKVDAYAREHGTSWRGSTRRSVSLTRSAQPRPSRRP